MSECKGGKAGYFQLAKHKPQSVKFGKEPIDGDYQHANLPAGMLRDFSGENTPRVTMLAIRRARPQEFSHKSPQRYSCLQILHRLNITRRKFWCSTPGVRCTLGTPPPIWKGLQVYSFSFSSANASRSVHS